MNSHTADLALLDDAASLPLLDDGSRAKHTPGPLHVTGDTDGWSASHDGIGTSEFRAIAEADGRVVALVVAHDESHFADLDTKSNADLFSVAPEMAKIVERLAALQDGLNNGNSAAEHEACRLAEHAAAVLAKIRGAA